MKTIEYLSPTSITTYLTDKQSFYLKYLSDNRPPREQQTRPMCAGSAFDSYVKGWLRHVLFGDNYESVRDGYFTDSVEEHNRDWAFPVGQRIFDNYRESGALADLILDMAKAKETPRFEFFLSSKDQEHRIWAGGIKFLGKPDAWYVNAFGCHIILDWKVNGFCSSASPKPGYVMIRDGIIPPGEKASRGIGKAHKDCIMMGYQGQVIDTYFKMEDKDQDWARQLSIYAWLAGEAVGAELVAAVDQLVFNDRGRMRVAEHRCMISPAFQFSTFNDAKEIWANATDGHFFKELSFEESKVRCETLDGMKSAMEDPDVAAIFGR